MPVNALLRGIDQYRKENIINEQLAFVHLFLNSFRSFKGQVMEGIFVVTLFLLGPVSSFPFAKTSDEVG